MKVVHISALYLGGAAICTKRIHSSLQKLGVDSRILFATGSKDEYTDVVEPDTSYPWSKNVLVRKVQAYLCRKHLWPYTEYYKHQYELVKDDIHYTFSSPVTEYQNLAEHPWIKEADIIHLHWIGDFVDYPSFFSKVGKPIVWTLHDLNPGLGGFHYMGQYKVATEAVKSLSSKFEKVKKCALKKAKDLNIVCISSFMDEFVKSNSILGSFPRTIIHNGIECDSFTPIEKSVARKNLNISAEKTVIMFSSYWLYDERKGLSLLVEALEKLNNPDILLLCVGKYKEKLDTSVDIHYMGLVESMETLMECYSASDLFVQSSFEEAFAQCPLEAMACGVPVVSFPCSGAEDLIRPFNGVVCDDFTVPSLLSGIKKALANKYDSNIIREYIVKNFSYDIIGAKYKELYETINHHG